MIVTPDHSHPIGGPKEGSPTLDVVFAADVTYIPHLATAVTSLLETNTELVGRLFVLTDDSASEPYRRFERDIQDRYGITAEPLRITPRLLEGLYVSGHVSSATYNRFLLGDLLPPEVSTVLYLDSDLVVTGDLTSLADATKRNLEDEACPIVWAVSRDKPDHLVKFGHSGSAYFNAGVLLVNLVKWRAEAVADSLFSTARELNGQLHLWDQDVLNLVLESRWGELPGVFNETDLKQASSSARIIHFVGGSKPWMVGSSHPHKTDYDRFRSLTPFWPYQREGLGKFLVKTFVPRPLQKPRKLVRRLGRRLRRRLGALIGR